MKVLGVIPARGGSTRIPRKNLELMGWKTLTHIAIEQLKQAKAVTTRVLSTDCVDIAAEVNNTAHGYDTSIYIVARKCGADGPMVDVLRECLAETHREDHPFQAVACVQPTSPLRLARDIDACVQLLDNTWRAGSVVSVDETTGKRNGAVYVTRVELIGDGIIFDEHSLKYPMPHERSIDINDYSDLESAREMWAKLYG